MKTGAAYLRLSYKLVNGELIAESRDGIARQKENIKALAAAHGADLPEEAVFLEDDTSASKVRGSQTEWAKCLAYVRKHQPDVLLGTAADRLGRRLADIEGLEDLARNQQMQVLTLKEGDLFASPAWPFIAAQAKVESMNTSIRVRDAQRARRATGRDSIGGKRPYGYAANRMTVLEDEAAIVREVARRILSGESTNSIVADLNRRKIEPVTKGKPWSVVMVRRMAANPRYAGIQTYQGEIIGKAAWPAIIERETHEALKIALETTAKPREGRFPTSLLGGIVRCGACESTMFSTKSGRNLVPVYRCSGGRGKAGCGRYYRGRLPVEEFIVESLLSSLKDEVIGRECDEFEARAEELAQQMVENDLDIYTLKAARDEQKIAAQDYYDDLDRLRKREARLNREHGKIVQEVRRLQQSAQARDRWESWTVAERRAFVVSHVVTIIVHPNGKRGPNRPMEPGEIEIVPRNRMLESPAIP